MRIKYPIICLKWFFLHVLICVCTNTHTHPTSPFLSEIGEQLESQLCIVITEPPVVLVFTVVLQVTLAMCTLLFLTFIVQSVL